MSLREAYRRCPDAVFLPVDGRRYQAASRDVMAILRRYTPLVEPISIDEAFLDVTGSAALFGDGPTIARRIKDETRAEVGLTASVGVATTKLVAKIASDLQKPDGLVVVPPGSEAAFLEPLPIGRLWGVGEKTATALAEYGVRTIGDLAALPPDLVVRRFGKHGGVARRSRARDGWRPGPRRRPGEVGQPRAHLRRRHERPRGHRADPARRWPTASSGRLRSAGVKAGTIAVKIRDSGFHTITRQRTLAEPTDLTDPIYADRARPRPPGAPRDEGPAARRRRHRTSASASSCRCSTRPIRGGGARSRPRMRCGDGTASGPSRAAGSSGRGCRRRSSATRAIRSTGGREVVLRGQSTSPSAAATDGADRDSQGDTDLDDIPPDDA